MTSRTLLFCIALNHYDRIYDRNMASHRTYAAHHGYEYALVRKLPATTVREAVWLKIALIARALEQGYDWVLFVDADCEIRPEAPPVTSIAAPGKSVFLAKGFSGNVNSGVIIAHNDPGARCFFDDVLGAADQTVPEQDWGENGHVIHFANRSDAVHVLDRRWNNNADPELDDFIRHYSAGGPMRPLYAMSVQGRAARLFVRVRNKLWKLAGRHDVVDRTLGRRLASLATACGDRYPAFARMATDRALGAQAFAKRIAQALPAGHAHS